MPTRFGVCGAKRARTVALAIACHIALGGGVLFGTFTISHDRGEELDRVWDVLGKGWRHMTSGQSWVDFKDAYGLIGSIKTVEVTHGINGWHPHIHVLFFVDDPMGDFDREGDYREFRRFLRERWIKYFDRHQGRNVSREFGTRFDPVKADESDQVGTYCPQQGHRIPDLHRPLPGPLPGPPAVRHDRHPSAPRRAARRGHRVRGPRGLRRRRLPPLEHGRPRRPNLDRRIHGLRRPRQAHGPARPASGNGKTKAPAPN